MLFIRELFLQQVSRLIVFLGLLLTVKWLSYHLKFTEGNVWKFVVDTTTECLLFYILWREIYSSYDVPILWVNQILIVHEVLTTVNLLIIFDLFRTIGSLDLLNSVRIYSFNTPYTFCEINAPHFSMLSFEYSFLFPYWTTITIYLFASLHSFTRYTVDPYWRLIKVTFTSSVSTFAAISWIPLKSTS